MFALLHSLAMFVIDFFKSPRRLEVENLFLRHQLSIALRRAPCRLRLRSSDRALLVQRTPTEIADRLNREINAALVDPKVKARLADLGGTVLALSPADYGSSTLRKSKSGPRWSSSRTSRRSDPRDPGLIFRNTRCAIGGVSPTAISIAPLAPPGSAGQESSS